MVLDFKRIAIAIVKIARLRSQRIDVAFGQFERQRVDFATDPRQPLGQLLIGGLAAAQFAAQMRRNAGIGFLSCASAMSIELDADNSFVLSPDAFAQEDDIRRQLARGLH